MNVNLTERPLALPAVWAQVSGVRIRSANEAARSLEASRPGPCGIAGVARNLLVGRPRVRVMAAGAPQLPQVHQVSRQAVMVQARAQLVQVAASYGTNGTTGFRGDDIATAKQMADGVSGAPPRGRPV